MDLHREIICSVVSRCRKSSLRETLARWGRLSNGQLNDEVLSGNKRQVAEKVIRLLEKDGLNDEIVGDLELVYIQLHSKSKMWVVYRLVGNDVQLNLDPRTLRSKVIHNLKLKWRKGSVYGNMGVFAGAVWLRMNLSQRALQGKKGRKHKTYDHNNSVFVVTYPSSPYVFLSTARTSLTKVVTEAIIDAVNAESLENIRLSGRHVSSLADIALRKDSKFLSSKYRDKEEQENPLLVKQDRKRRAYEECFSDTEDMIDENRQEKRFRRNVIEKKFGSEPQPVLEKLDFKFTSKFHGKLNNMECKSSVEIKGPSVLDGLCQLAMKGLVKLPLPNHLTAATRCARNSFTVESKKK